MTMSSEWRILTQMKDLLNSFEMQLKAVLVSDPRQIRWHFVIIKKWWLNLKLLSSSSYHALRTSGFIKLPSDRSWESTSTTSWTRQASRMKLIEQLINEISLQFLPDTRIRLVYSKHLGEIVGFTNLGDINDDSLQLEQEGE